MEIIAHRRNNLNALKSTPNKYGIEIDIRTYAGELIIMHDPFCNGIKLNDWLKSFNHGTLILNVKEEGLEENILEIMKNFKINNFFFLDQSFPFLIKTVTNGEKRCAVRYSEYESINTVLKLKGLIDWVWIDFFNKFPLNKETFEILKDNQFKLCIVSPELQGFGKEDCHKLKEYIEKNNLMIDAVCTKNLEIWDDK